jgi:hypothetical protein
MMMMTNGEEYQSCSKPNKKKNPAKIIKKIILKLGQKSKNKINKE